MKKLLVYSFMVFVLPFSLEGQSRRGSSSLEPLAGVARYALDGEHRFGPVTGIRFALHTQERVSIGLAAGLAFRVSGWFRSTTYENGDVPVWMHNRLPRESETYSMRHRPVPRLSLALGFLGPDVTVYFAEGDVRPYAGLGAQLVLFPYSETLGVTTAPYVRAGLDVRIRSGFSAFGEIRHAVGLSQLASPAGRNFDEFSVLAAGISFTPRFN